jgi:hypothetical protein
MDGLLTTSAASRAPTLEAKPAPRNAWPPDALKGHEGHHIAATGSIKGDSIHVDSMKML